MHWPHSPPTGRQPAALAVTVVYGLLSDLYGPREILRETDAVRLACYMHVAKNIKTVFTVAQKTGCMEISGKRAKNERFESGVEKYV